MHISLRAGIACAVATFASAAGAQRPEVSGSWAAVPGEAPANLAAAPSATMGTRFGLRVDGATVVLTRPARDQTLVATLPLDGTRTASRVPGRLCEGEPLFHETATWEGDALVITNVGITPAGGGQASESRARRLIRSQGPDRLVVEATVVQGGQARQVGTVYRRTTDSLPAPQAPSPGAPATIAQVAWIGATWVGTTNNITTEERWTPPASGGMMALSRTLRGTALASFEFLCIAERDGSLAYIAMPDGRTPPTVFTLTSITATSATFENPTHDFPKLIRYSQTADGSLETTIAGAAGARPRSVLLKKQ